VNSIVLIVLLATPQVLAVVTPFLDLIKLRYLLPVVAVIGINSLALASIDHTIERTLVFLVLWWSLLLLVRHLVLQLRRSR
jgi:hypothetical protein